MTTAPGVWLGDLTWPEAKERFDAGAVVLVPIGAGSKEHGHHLPLKTDYLLARELSERVIAALPVVVDPVVTLGYFPAFVRYPGSQHLRSETFIALLKDVFAKLARDGVQNLAVINTGVSTEAPLRVVVRDIYEACGLRVNTADIRALGLDVEATMEQKLGGHGDESETSMILAIEPDSVRMERAEVDYGHGLDIPKTVFYQPGVFDGDESSGLNYSKTGVRGDPTLATAAKGEALLSAMAKELVEGLRLALSGRARVSWDVVVIGYGYAGAMAAIEARDAGASVLLLEKMAEPGGISICSAGGVRIAFDAEGALDYLEATNAGTTPTSVLRGLAEGMVEPPDRLRELARVNAARVEVRPAKGNYPFPGHESFGFAEVEDVPGFSSEVAYPNVRGSAAGARLFKVVEDNVRERGIEVRLETGARRLLTDGAHRVMGIDVDTGEPLHAGAVVLACGGFEADAEMQKQFWQGKPVLPAAFRGNTGDGIRMAQALGAGLWHMWHYHGSYGFQHPDPSYPFGCNSHTDTDHRQLRIGTTLSRAVTSAL